MSKKTAVSSSGDILSCHDFDKERNSTFVITTTQTKQNRPNSFYLKWHQCFNKLVIHRV